MSEPSRQPGFLATLFDATFSNLLGVRLLRALYLLGVLATGTYAFVVLFAGIGQGLVPGLLSLVVVPVVALTVIGLLRAGFEALVAIHRAGEHIEHLSKTLYTLSTHLRSTGSGGATAGGGDDA